MYYTLVDNPEREKALDCTKNIHCESPAGSGKTTLLTDRFLKLLAQANHPHDLLALTFTNKAAGQMRQRIWDALKEAEKGKVGLHDRRLILAKEVLRRHKDKKSLLYSPEGLRIMTFHSLCYAVVKAFPLEANLPTHLSVTEGVEYEELLRRITDETLEAIACAKEGDQIRGALERWLLRTNNNWPRLRYDCMNLMKRRDYLKELIALIDLHKDMHSFQEMADKALGVLIDDFMEKTRSAIIHTDLGKRWKELEFLTEKGGIQDSPPNGQWSNLSQWQVVANLFTTKTGTPRKRLPKDLALKRIVNKNPLSKKNIVDLIGSLPKEVCRMLGDLKELPHKGYKGEQIHSLYDLIIILRELISAWQSICLKEGIIDFVGLELACLRVLRQMPISEMQFILGNRIRHILVDEFQDTSRNQWELLQYLCSGWSVGEGRTLFLVGDPKQSIYGFRNAEVSLFLEAKKGLPLPGEQRLVLECITLRNNFRSASGLVEWTNHLFGCTVMANPRMDMDEVPFSPSSASIDGDHQLCLNLFVQTDSLPDPQAEEAKCLATAVKGLYKGIREDESIGILLFTRTRISLYLQALNEIGVPVNVRDGLVLIESLGVLSIHQMLKAFVRPHDNLAWASLLRLPWCCWSPDVLCKVSEKGDMLWVDKIAAYMESEEAPGKMRGWWEILKSAKKRVGRDPLSKIVKDAWLDMEGAYKIKSLFGTESVESILRYLDIVEECEEFIPEETLEKVEMAIKVAYMPPPPEAYDSRIELMTVHKSKGLEFDYVFCPYMDWDPLGGGYADQYPYLMETLSEGESVLAVRKDKREERDDLIYNFLLKKNNGKKRAEAKRLFYVAATRAKKGLYLSGIAKIRDGKLYARSQDAPVSFIISHEGIGEWDIDTDNIKDFKKAGKEGIAVCINPTISDWEDLCRIPLSPFIAPLPEPFPKLSEKLPYIIVSPSEKEYQEDILSRKDIAWTNNNIARIDDVNPQARVRGNVIRQIFASISQGNPLPSEKAVVSALYRDGLSIKEANSLSGSILKQVTLCMNEHTCAWINSTDHTEAYSEWSLEDNPKEGVIRSGIIDRLIYDGKSKRWWIVDYKTVYKELKEQERDQFFDLRAGLYKYQMESYRDMVSNWRGIKQEEIILLIYFTAFQKPYTYPI